MPDDQDEEQTTDDQSASQSDQSDEQSSEGSVADESTEQPADDQGGAQQTTDDQSTGQAAQSDDQTLKDPVVSVVEDNTAEVGPSPDAANVAIATAEGGGGGGVDVVNLGKFAWDVVKDNAPVSNQSSDNANAVPKGVDFMDMKGWSNEPRRMKLHYHTENNLGMNATDIDLICEWYYNGYATAGAAKGPGQFINAATVYAKVDVSWGSTINIKASIEKPMNMGTDFPIAALPVRVSIQHSNVTQNFTTVYSGQFKGNGAGYLNQE